MEYTFDPNGTGSWDFRINRRSLGCWISKYIVRRVETIRIVREWFTMTFEHVFYAVEIAMHRAIIVVGGNREMVSQPKGISPTLVKEGKRVSGESADTAGYKLHLAMDKASYTQLVWLKGALQAASFGEVLRRALNAYEIFDPDDLSEESGISSDRAKSPVPAADIKHLYIVIPHGMKEQLDDEKTVEGRAYADTIRRALCVLTQLVRERAKLVAKVEKGGNNNDRENQQTGNHINPVLLASL
ncbi:hypothetical protein [Cochlodiniinecator piscidefendens]|uniref:hypothetical protein n=1 Tax=Cochlodiniinecator piscidefendens TaxID=2715756 RepID=UPI001407DB6D|nr:hypothetical protein [Cochlodiniinecator piscidefendens]